MKKYAVTIILTTGSLISTIFSGCQNTASSMQPDHFAAEISLSETAAETTTESTISELPSEKLGSSAISTTATQGGPYGEISLSIPDGWSYEAYPIDTEQLITGLYGIHFYPDGVSDGYIELAYVDSFGVCGTGLAEEQSILAGQPVNIGTYDDHAYWDFISFRDDYKGIIALTYYVDDWWETYKEQTMDILNTLSYDPTIKEGGAYVYSPESEINQIGLSFALKNISPTGAILVFRCYDADAPTGELDTGDDFVLEVQKDGIWQEVPIILEGNYGFNALAYIIAAGNTTELELSWEWLYGTLSPGTYRIQKSVMDFRESGDYDKYTIYAQFVLN